MFLIADSGSSKTLWRLVNAQERRNFETAGINPFYLESQEIVEILHNELPIDPAKVENIYFYGSGCTPLKQNEIKAVLEEYFFNAKAFVESDLLGAARSLCGNKTGIAAILGTGSNSCRYDGLKIADQIAPLGYVLGDNGSGADLGKRLITAALRNRLSQETTRRFFELPDTEAILDRVYRHPFPNRYLASFAVFLHQNINIPELTGIVESSFTDFIEQQILPYHCTANEEIHFTGSIAFFFKEILEKSLNKYGLQLGRCTQNPIDGLDDYHNAK